MRSVNIGRKHSGAGGSGGVSDFRAHAQRRGAPFPARLDERGAMRAPPLVGAGPDVPSPGAKVPRAHRKFERPIAPRAGLTAPELSSRPNPSHSAARQSGR